MKRLLETTLNDWKNKKKRKPLLLRGARQVGKTYLVEKLGKKFENFISINFELESQYIPCFESLDPQAIIQAINIQGDLSITPGNTLLFLDEVQMCPRAIIALRYFYEKLPALHIIAAGSLLEFAIQRDNISMPVGRVEYLYLHPCTFEEYVDNATKNDILSVLASISLSTPPQDSIHQKLLNYVKNYMIIGGMPEALDEFIDAGDYKLVERVQSAILQTYRDDFGKYATHTQQGYIQTVYDKAPGLSGTQIAYHKINPDVRSRELKNAITLLEYAGLVKRIMFTSGSTLPFATTANEKKFKLQFLDIGLVQHASGMSAKLLLESNFKKLNDGQLAEQFVGQHLIAHQDPFMTPQLYFWARDKRNAQAEIDFVIHIDGEIIPIEVKSGPTGKLKSLQLFMHENNSNLGIKISTAPLSIEGKILNIPFYLIGQLERLVKEQIG